MCSQCPLAAGQTDSLNLHTVVCQCVPCQQFSVVDTPEAAVALCQWLHSEKVAGRIGSVHLGLKMLGKDRQTVQWFKHVYYMSVQNKGLYEEVSAVMHYALALNTQYYNDVQPTVSGQKKGLVTLDAMCKPRMMQMYWAKKKWREI